jgi:TonB family protein
LRVARGLLRKNSDAAASSANVHSPAASAVPVAPTSPLASLTIKDMEPTGVPAFPTVAPEFQSALPAMAASAKAEESAVVVAPEAPPKTPVADTPLPEAQIQAAAEQAPPPAMQVAPKTTQALPATFHPNQGAAAAAAPAREAPPEKKMAETVEFEAAYQKVGSTAKFDVATASTKDGPSFTGLDQENVGLLGNKKILAAVAAVLVFAALGYMGWTKLSAPKTSVADQAVSQPQAMSAPATASTAPVLAPVTPPSTDRGAANTPTGAAKVAVGSAIAPAAASSSPALRIDANSKPETKNLDVTRIVVKTTPAKQSSARAEEMQLPNPLGVGASNQSGLSGLADVSLRSQPSLAKVNISQGVSQGLVIRRVQPRYPQNALAMHLQGSVQLDAMIDKEGKIANLKVLKGDAVLARAAMDAVRQWRYKPYYLDGVPVDIQTQITVNFKLPE